MKFQYRAGHSRDWMRLFACAKIFHKNKYMKKILVGTILTAMIFTGCAKSTTPAIEDNGTNASATASGTIIDSNAPASATASGTIIDTTTKP